MDIDRFVSTEEDLAYEYELQTQSTNFLTWTRYLDYKKSRDDPVALAWLYERCTNEFPNSVDLWLEYLKWRTDLIQSLNAVFYVDEFTKCNALFERALRWCFDNDRIWIMYLKFAEQQRDLGMIRSILNRSLRCVSLEKHPRIWESIISFIEDDLLQNANFLEDNELEALMHDALFRKEEKRSTSPDLWSSHMLVRYLEITDSVEHTLYLLGLTGDDEAVRRVYERYLFPDTFSVVNYKQHDFYLRYINALGQVGTEEEFQEGVERTIIKFPHLSSSLMVELAKNFIMRSKIPQARSTLDNALKATIKTRDFSVIYDFYLKFLEVLVETIIQEIRVNPEIQPTWEQELTYNFNLLEHLTNTHELLLNDLKVRQDGNNVNTWIARANLFSSVKEKCEVYVKAILSIDPGEVHEANVLGQLWCNYAKLFIDAKDYESARETFDRALRVPYKYKEDLEIIWLCWAEMELEIGGFEGAIKLLEKALKIPKHPELLIEKYDKRNKDFPAQAVIFTSLKLWTMYLDVMEASCEDSDQVLRTREAYNNVIGLKLATPLIFINYAHFLQAQNMWDESFQIYERAIAAFPPQTKYELWNIYLGECSKRNLSTERQRDLFEQALQLSKHEIDCSSFFLLYSNLERSNGLYKRSVDILYRGCKETNVLQSKVLLWRSCLDASKNFLGDENSRPFYEECIKTLPNSKAILFVIDFAKVEERLQAYERSRAILKFGAQLLHPDQNKTLWEFWNEFEVRHGSKSTYKEMLKLKRHVGDTFKVNTEQVTSKDGNVAFIASSDVGGTRSALEHSQVTNPEEISLDL